eukprot:jgi/Bigna1/76504/fgenesh1_pg.41_\
MRQVQLSFLACIAPAPTPQPGSHSHAFTHQPTMSIVNQTLEDFGKANRAGQEKRNRKEQGGKGRGGASKRGRNMNRQGQRRNNNSNYYPKNQQGKNYQANQQPQMKPKPQQKYISLKKLKRVLVSNFAEDITVDQLWEAFEEMEFGKDKIKTLECNYNSRGQFNGSCIVEFHRAVDAEKCVEEWDSAKVDQREIFMDFIITKEELYALRSQSTRKESKTSTVDNGGYYQQQYNYRYGYKTQASYTHIRLTIFENRQQRGGRRGGRGRRGGGRGGGGRGGSFKKQNKPKKEPKKQLTQEELDAQLDAHKKKVANPEATATTTE